MARPCPPRFEDGDSSLELFSASDSPLTTPTTTLSSCCFPASDSSLPNHSGAPSGPWRPRAPPSWFSLRRGSGAESESRFTVMPATTCEGRFEQTQQVTWGISGERSQQQRTPSSSWDSDYLVDPAPRSGPGEQRPILFSLRPLTPSSGDSTESLTKLEQRWQSSRANSLSTTRPQASTATMDASDNVLRVPSGDGRLTTSSRPKRVRFNTNLKSDRSWDTKDFDVSNSDVKGVGGSRPNTSRFSSKVHRSSARPPSTSESLAGPSTRRTALRSNTKSSGFSGSLFSKTSTSTEFLVISPSWGAGLCSAVLESGGMTRMSSGWGRGHSPGGRESDSTSSRFVVNDVSSCAHSWGTAVNFRGTTLTARSTSGPSFTRTTALYRRESKALCVAKVLSGWSKRTLNDTVSDHAGVIVQAPKRYFVWVALLSLSLLLQVGAFRASGDRCSLEFVGSDEDISRAQYALLTVPTFCFLPWGVAALLARLVDHRGKFLPDSAQHVWLWRYTFTTVVSSMQGAARLHWSCGLARFVEQMDDSPRGRVLGVLLELMAITPLVCISCARLLLCHMARLKLRLLAAAEPRLTSLGEKIFVYVLLLDLVQTTLYVAVLLGDHAPHLVALHMLVVLPFLCVYLTFWGAVAMALRRTACAAKAESREADVVIEDVRELYRVVSWTKRTAKVLTIAAVITSLSLVSLRFVVRGPAHRSTWPAAAVLLKSGIFALDTFVSAFSAALLSGLIGPSVVQGHAEEELEMLTLHAQTRRRRRIYERLLEAQRDGISSAAAATIAALIGHQDPEDLITQAERRFRAVSWSTLQRHKDVVCGGDHVEDFKATLSEVGNLGEACFLGSCDVFLSHSWRDDAELKWNALSAWCEDFREAESRAPVIWFDRICIDQRNIAVDLECLPIFLAGCNRLLILSGEAYPTRLWCALELFVYTAMHMSNTDAQVGIDIIPLGSDAQELDRVWIAWRRFDVFSCECFDPGDKERILSVISHSAGGTVGFNARVLNLIQGFVPRRCRSAFDSTLSEGLTSAIEGASESDTASEDGAAHSDARHVVFCEDEPEDGNDTPQSATSRQVVFRCTAVPLLEGASWMTH